MRTGRAFPSSPLAPFAAQRAQAALLQQQPAVSPPRPALVVSQRRQARSRPRTIATGYASARGAASLALEALVSAPYRQVYQSAASRERPRAATRGSIQDPYASQLARASLLLEALVTPPSTRTLIVARSPVQHRRGSVTAIRPVLASPIITPSRMVVVARTPRQRRDGLVLAPRPILFVVAPLVTPPRVQTIVMAPQRAARRPRTVIVWVSAPRTQPAIPPPPPPAAAPALPSIYAGPASVTSYSGPLVIAVGTFTFSKSYPAGGEPFSLTFTHPPIAAIRFSPVAGYVFEYVATTGRVKAYRSGGTGSLLAEPTGADLSAVSPTFIAWSR